MYRAPIDIQILHRSKVCSVEEVNNKWMGYENINNQKYLNIK